MRKHSAIRLKGLLTVLCLLTFMAGTAGAITYEITAGVTDLPMSDGTVVPVWGYAITASEPGGTFADGVIKVPGDPLVVPPGDNLLAIYLTNNLPEATSLHILGQTLSNNTGPVFTTDPSGLQRVMSFSHETPVGGTVLYEWNDFKPGTYMLQSGTNPARQVQMGLYAAVKKDSAPAEAYPGVPYDQELILVFHDIDPFMHDAIDGGTYKSSVYREPRYYLINGKSYPNIPDPLFTAIIGARVLIRFVNAGLVTHAPQILGMYMSVVAEDGVPYTYPLEFYGLDMPAAKTMDAVLVPSKFGPVDGKFPIYDGRLKLSNFGTYQGAIPGGGMLAYLETQVGGGVQALDDEYTTDEDVQLSVPPPGVLSNDIGAVAAMLETNATSGNAVVNADGSFTYTPNENFNGIDTFVYRATDTVADDLATVTITVAAVNDLPVAVDDAAATITTNPVVIDVLANDTDAENDPLTVSGLPVLPTNGTATINPDDTVTYTANVGFTGTDTFTYTANDGTGDSVPAGTVTVTVNAAVNTLYVDPSGSCGGNAPCYTTINAALAAAGEGTRILVIQGIHNEEVLDNNPVSVLLIGGYNDTFDTVVSTSSVNSLTIQAGTLEVENLVIGNP